MSTIPFSFAVKAVNFIKTSSTGNCANVQCSHKQVCIADKEGNSYCIHTHCPSTCPRAANQVCGTDNKAYSNLCSLKKASCLSGRKIHFAYLGPCTGRLAVVISTLVAINQFSSWYSRSVFPIPESRKSQVTMRSVEF